MPRKSQLSEIHGMKVFLDQGRNFFMAGLALRSLAKEANSAKSEDLMLDVYPVRAVAITEVECRHLVRELAGHSLTYARRAASLVNAFKPDFEILLSISEREFTFADIAARSMSFSSLESIIATFERLLEIDLPASLAIVTDAFGYAPDEKLERIIGDFRGCCAEIVELFSLRHRICHEALDPDSPELENVADRLSSLACFMDSLHSTVVRQMYPNLPRTQLEINEQAAGELREKQKEMQEYLQRMGYRGEPDDMSRLAQSQRAWEAYVGTQQNLRHDPDDYGTIAPYLWAKEAELLTRQRVERLKWFVEKREGEL